MSPAMDTRARADQRLAAEVVDALYLLLRLRKEVPHRSRAWWLLNNACCHLSDGFWREVGLLSRRPNGNGNGHHARNLGVSV